MKSRKVVRFLMGVISAGVFALASCQPRPEVKTNQIPITGQNNTNSESMPAPTSTVALTDTDVSGLSATIGDLSGGVNAKQPEDQNFSPASIGLVLLPSGQVKTSDTGRARLDLSSGTLVRVAPSSLFTLQSNASTPKGPSTVLNLDLGKLFIILKGGNLDVSTPSGVASVRGSYMMVSIDPYTHSTVITCLEGHCSASNPAGSVDFTTGQKCILYFSANGQFTLPIITVMTQGDYDTWATNSPESQPLMTALGISYSTQSSSSGSSDNCPESRALGCNDHPGNGK